MSKKFKQIPKNVTIVTDSGKHTATLYKKGQIKAVVEVDKPKSVIWPGVNKSGNAQFEGKAPSGSSFRASKLAKAVRPKLSGATVVRRARKVRLDERINRQPSYTSIVTGKNTEQTAVNEAAAQTLIEKGQNVTSVRTSKVGKVVIQGGRSEKKGLENTIRRYKKRIAKAKAAGNTELASTLDAHLRAKVDELNAGAKKIGEKQFAKNAKEAAQREAIKKVDETVAKEKAEKESLAATVGKNIVLRNKLLPGAPKLGEHEATKLGLLPSKDPINLNTPSLKEVAKQTSPHAASYYKYKDALESKDYATAKEGVKELIQSGHWGITPTQSLGNHPSKFWAEYYENYPGTKNVISGGEKVSKKEAKQMVTAPDVIKRVNRPSLTQKNAYGYVKTYTTAMLTNEEKEKVLKSEIGKIDALEKSEKANPQKPEHLKAPYSEGYLKILKNMRKK